MTSGDGSSRARLYEQVAAERLREARVGRAYSGRKMVLVLMALITATALVANYLAQAARDAKPLPSPSASVPR